MKTITIKTLVLALALNSSVFADNSEIVENIKAVCQSPSDFGKYWDIKLTGKGDAKGNVRLAKVGLVAEAVFSKGEWEGVQQVLKSHQKDDNANYRDCARELTPLFLKKFSTTTPEDKEKSKPSAKADKVQKDSQSVGDVTGKQIVIQKEVKGDANISFGDN